ncbi:MAG: hypothetical protein Q9168_002198, partial [Polycauliona sp. 1 TL-2023]
MGRKPNQLVLEYFDRGAKLVDNSNRYVQTCKACGKTFPKGRIESLTAHIEKDCVSIRREDRSRILSAAVPSPLLPHQNGNQVNAPDYERTQDHQSLPTVNGGRSLTGLEALAEASRQLEHPSPHGTAPARQNAQIDPDLDGDHPISGLLDTGRSLVENGDHNTRFNSGTHAGYANPSAAIDPSHASSMNLYHSRKPSQDPARLSLIAASATDLEARLPPINGERRDQHHTSQSPASVLHESLLPREPLLNTGSSVLRDPIEDPTSMPGLTPAAPGPLLNRLHIRSKPERSPSRHNRGSDKPHGRAQKVRGKFTDSRRQEVQEIRKKGACIRCRMLRKTCSGESPCKTCASVVSARVWKLDCMRTSIYKEVDVFCTGYFGKMASRQLERCEEQKSQERGECFIKFATGATDSGSSLSFICQLDRRKEAGGFETRDHHTQGPMQRIMCIDGTADQILSKLLPYMRKTILHPNYNEPPLLSSQTFGAISRSEDKLLATSFDLWALTQVIVSSPHSWAISSHPPNNNSQHQAKQAEESCQTPSSSPLPSNVFTAQLQAAAEQGACNTSKTIMIELEKRLERKDKCQGFETFFVGIILLNCIERMCWALKKAAGAADGEAQDSTPLRNPVDTHIHQSTQFASFLSKLFQMRGILADVHPNPTTNILQGGSRSTPTVDLWLSEMRFT